MKELSVVFNVSVSDEVVGALAGAGVGEYTLVPRCRGRGKVTEPRMDDHVWPGINSLLLAVVDDAAAQAAMKALQALRDGNAGKAGVFAYLKPVEATLVPPLGAP